MENYQEVSDLGTIEEWEGKKIMLKGVLSDVQWQHLIHAPKTHPIPHFFEVGSLQIVIYAKEKITHKRQICIYGTIVKIESLSQNLDQVKRQWEYQMIVDKWEKA